MRRSDIGARPLGSILRADAGDAAAVEAALSGAFDALLLDLTADRMATDAAARLAARERSTGPLLLVRLPRPDEGAAEALAAARTIASDAVVAVRAETGADLQHLGAILAVEEAKAGLDDGGIGIVAVAETSAALFGLIGFAAASPRLVAIGWDGEALGRDLGGETREDDGRWSDPLQTSRTLTLAAAADAKLPAIDGPFATHDRDAFRREAERAKRDGFAGKVALDAVQAAIVAEVFPQA